MQSNNRPQVQQHQNRPQHDGLRINKQGQYKVDVEQGNVSAELEKQWANGAKYIGKIEQSGLRVILIFEK